MEVCGVITQVHGQAIGSAFKNGEKVRLGSATLWVREYRVWLLAEKPATGWCPLELLTVKLATPEEKAVVVMLYPELEDYLE